MAGNQRVPRMEGRRDDYMGEFRIGILCLQKMKEAKNALLSAADINNNKERGLAFI